MEFSEKEYRALVKMAFVGGAVLGQNLEEEEFIAEFGGVDEKLWSMAKDYKVSDLLVKEEGGYMPSHEMMEEMMETLEEYSETCFWENLTQWMADRDLLLKDGEKTVNALSPEKYAESVQPYYDKYDKEFSDNGIANLFLKSK